MVVVVVVVGVCRCVGVNVVVYMVFRCVGEKLGLWVINPSFFFGK